MISKGIALLVWILLNPVAEQATPSKFDWPQWRGPDRTGLSKETGLLKKWPNEGLTVLWRTKNLGGGYSTPSVAAGHIYGMSYRGEQEVVWCLDEKSGKELWHKTIGTKVQVGYGDGSRCTPTVDSDRLYVVGIDGDLACLKTENGDIVWQKKFSTDFAGRMMSGWGFSESPLIDGDKLLCTPGADKAAVVCLNKINGEVIWKSEVAKAGGAGYASIIKAEVDGLPMYITLLGKSGGVVGLSAKDGKLLWRYTKINNGTANIPTVLFRDNIVFCSTGYRDGGTAVLKLTKNEDKIDVEEIKSYVADELQNHHGGMVLVGDYVYMGHGHNNGYPACVEFNTGKILWKESKGAGNRSGCVTYADGMLYFRYEDGTLALVEANPKEYKLVSKFKIPEPTKKPSWPHPVVANGKLLIRDQDNLWAFDVKAK